MQHNLKIAICEDDNTQLEYVKHLVEAWMKAGKIPSTVDGYVSAEQLLFSFDADFPYSIYILDIEMGEMNGMELAHKIREQDTDAVIIFLTGLREYALEGYEVGAFRYLIKPIKEQELHRILGEIIQTKEIQKEAYFLLNLQGELRKIPYDDIWYISSQGHYVEMAYREEKIQWKASFGSLQKEFENNGFVLSRRGILVNVSRIAKVGREECVLDNEEKIPISRSQYKEVNAAFIRYFRGGEES